MTMLKELKEAALLPGIIKDARSHSAQNLLKNRKREVMKELEEAAKTSRTSKKALFRDAENLILRGEARVSELAPVFVEIGVIDQNSYVGALKLALMLGNDNILKKAVGYALENGASIFEIQDVVCKEGFAQKMDVVYSVFSPTALPSYEFIFRAKEKYFGRQDIDGIKNAVALFLAKEKTTKILRNEYRKKGYVKEYSQSLMAEAESELGKVARDEDGKVFEDDFAFALYRAYFEDVCLFKNNDAMYYYLRLIEQYKIRSPFLTDVIKHALENGEKRAREKALMLIRDFGLDVDVLKVLKKENLNERVLALRILFNRGWNGVFREMLFSGFYKERKIALEAFLKYSPEISEEEEKQIRLLARKEIGKSGKLARALLKKIPERKIKEQKSMLIRIPSIRSIQPYVNSYVNRVNEAAKHAYTHAIENLGRLVEKSIEKSITLAKGITKGIGENSAKILESLNLSAQRTYRKVVGASKNVFAHLDIVFFKLRLEWIEKQARMAAYAKRITEHLAGHLAGVNWPRLLRYSLLSAVIGSTTSFFPRGTNRTAASRERSERIAHAVFYIVQKKEEEKRKMVSRLAKEVAEGKIPLSDALKQINTPEELIKELKKTEPPKPNLRPRIKMDDTTRMMYEEAMGLIGVEKGLDSSEYLRGLLVGQYYSKDVGANKWVNILIFGDNTAWTFPTSNLGSPIIGMESVNVGDILLNHVGSGYVLSDEDGYLVAYHDASHGLRIVKFSFEELKKEFDRVLSEEEANQFAKEKICKQLNIDPEKYTLNAKRLVFPTDYNCNRRWDDSLGCFVGNAHDFGAPREGGKRRHKGVDLYAPFRAPIYSPVDGIVVAAGWGGKKAGKRVWIKGVDGYYYMMAHLDSIAVKKGQFITAGTVIGKNGDTGNAKGLAKRGAAHDHQEVHKGGRGKDSAIHPDSRLYDSWFVGLEESRP